MDNCCCGRPKSSWAPPKAMRGKCERGRGSANADGGSVNAGAEVQTQTGRVRKSSRAMGARRGRLSTPWLRFHGVDRADVYIIIHVRACCCGECALNPPTSQPIPRRRPSPAPHSDTPFPSTSAPPRSADARPQAARCTPADRTTHYPQRHAASPSVPLRAQKNGTAQWMCDAECLGRPSLRSVIGVGEPRAVRRRCGALACRRGA